MGERYHLNFHAEGWLYLAAVMDLGSRRTAGWSMQDTLETSLVLDAFKMACQQQRPNPGMVHHSDRGCQYASKLYQQQLIDRGIVCSMSRKGNRLDNAIAESFFATLKKELVYRSSFATRAQARSSIFEYIEVLYNRQRRHSSLNYLTSIHYEQTYQAQVA